MATKTSTQIALTAKETDTQIIGNALANLITGNNYGIVINGDFGNDTINAGTGDDAIEGNEGNDIINGGAGFDSISGNTGNDTLNGGDNPDSLNGNDGNDLINGDAGEDVLEGGAGNDTLIGGSGDDEIFGDSGKDIMTGGDGADCFVFFAADSLVRKPDIITDFNKSAGDTLNFGDLVTLAGQWNSADAKAKPPATNINQAIFDTAKQTLYVNSDADSAFEFAVVLTGITDFSQIALI